MFFEHVRHYSDASPPRSLGAAVRNRTTSAVDSAFASLLAGLARGSPAMRQQKTCGEVWNASRGSGIGGQESESGLLKVACPCEMDLLIQQAHTSIAPLTFHCASTLWHSGAHLKPPSTWQYNRPFGPRQSKPCLGTLLNGFASPGVQGPAYRASTVPE